MAKLSREIKRLRSDHEIQRDVVDELHYDLSVTDADAIEVSVRDGVGTLRGTADSLAQRWAIERATRRVRGIQDVADELTVMYPKPDRRDDTDIQDAANVMLQWDARVPNGVAASVHGGVLTIRGAVARVAERAAAFDAVRNLIGVHGISNEIDVVAASSAAPDLRETLVAAIRRRIDSDDVRVEVDGGTVVLSGVVSSHAEREEIEQAAAMAPGVVQVDDRIRVES